ncbi:acetyltransferase [Fusobacterium pseudoperiodonticum]|jgi:sugar O-acyltransferase, sialic acid O-acetyltransferase neuD family|uniref:acetyltransferase n=1 Tax=Fusobacterium pseudoperiodonticum TaxID=2663009 RepID=UPI0028D2F68D|nr:acetyltransferase [Fusobacterium pseudoperiodonticum]
MREKILLVGAGQHARVVLYNIQEQNKYDVIGILDKNLDKAKEEKFFEGIPILDIDYSKIDLKELKEKLGTDKFFISFGNMKYRKKVWELFKNSGWNSVNIIHPNAVISKNAKLGEGILIECGCLITPNPIIGDNVVVNTGSQVNHDNIIENHVYIASGVVLSGGVKIGENTLLDDGVIVTLGREVGKNSLIGAGAVITKNLEDNIVAYGNPAKVIRLNDN